MTDNYRLATLRTRLKAACQAHYFDIATARANNQELASYPHAQGRRRKWTAQALADAAQDRRRIVMLRRALRKELANG